MKFNVRVLSLLLLLCAASCTSYKKVPYFQVGDVSSKQPKEFETFSYVAKSAVRFQPDDILAITVNVVGEQKIASDYNLPVLPSATSYEEGSDINNGIGRQTYLVSKNGEIDFPTLGLIRVAGYSQEELQEHIKRLLLERMKIVPVVTIRLVNFRISVLGEVNRPGQVIVNKDRIDLFEVLALAGDLTIHGKRDHVFVRRQSPDGTFKYVRLDISKADVTVSPFFYLQQNDVVYVQPNRAKSLQSDISMWSAISSVATFIVSVATFVVYSSK
jgi:polysaccharide export outer membrane protein